MKRRTLLYIPLAAIFIFSLSVLAVHFYNSTRNFAAASLEYKLPFFSSGAVKTETPETEAAGFFSGAAFTRSGENRYRIRYEALSQKALDDYLENEAERLRGDFLAHFPDGIELSREVWENLQAWTV